MSVKNESCTNDEKWPIKKNMALFTAAIAFLLGMFDLIDRQVVASLFPYLKAEFALNDKQLGLLMSVVNVAIAVLVLPSAYIVDRWSRKKMIFIMAILWSIATAMGYFATSFLQLLIFRFFCGIGEAGYQPAAQSLLGACFPRRFRGTAGGIVQSGMSLGVPIGLMLGAYVAEHFGWRHALGLVAIPGFLLSFAVLFVHDFKVVKPENKKEEKKVSYLLVVRDFAKTPTMICVFVGAIILRMYNGTVMSWLPSYFKRIAEMPMTSAGTLASSIIIVNTVAIFYGGPWIDWLRTKNKNYAPIWLAFAMTVCGILNFTAFYLCPPGSTIQIINLVVGNMFFGTVFSGGLFLVLDLSSADYRATAVSLMILAQNLFGYSLGPVFTGAISDMFDLATAMTVMSAVLIAGGIVYAISIYTYPKDLAKVKCVEIEF